MIKHDKKHYSNFTNPLQAYFTYPDAIRINEARMEHLASLGIDLRGKTVLEVGGGIGLLTEFFESQGCDVLFTDGRADNVEAVRMNYPKRKTAVVDLETVKDMTSLGKFDVVFCYGTLYHLGNPEETLKMLESVSKELLLLETWVSPEDGEKVYYERENAIIPNQAMSSTGCRPTRGWLMGQLKNLWGYGYTTVSQPDFVDFEHDWKNPLKLDHYRAIFVASRKPLDNSLLLESVPSMQKRMAEEELGVWIDVGAYSNSKNLFFENALHQGGIQVFAFDPNQYASSFNFAKAANYHYMPLAITAEDGVASYYIKADVSSNTLLKTESSGPTLFTAIVPTIRLDTFMKNIRVPEVSFLQIDVPGMELVILQSAGERIKDIRKIQVKVPNNTEKKDEAYASVIRYLGYQGFAVISVCEDLVGKTILFYKTAFPSFTHSAL